MRRILLIGVAIVLVYGARDGDAGFRATGNSARRHHGGAGTMRSSRSRAVTGTDVVTARCTVAGADIIMAGAAAVAITTVGAAVTIAATGITTEIRSPSSSPDE